GEDNMELKSKLNGSSAGQDKSGHCRQ
ncbi:28S ribosomal protein S11, mitochondrial isoform g, partial [Daubentonia madagascariensis]